MATLQNSVTEEFLHSYGDNFNYLQSPAQEPSNPTNPDIHTANATSRPTTTPPSKKTKTALTAEQKKDRHKRAEAVRRNKIDSKMTILQAWIPEDYRLPGKKSNAKKQSLCAAANWLEQLKEGNDELERTYNALVESHGLVTEGYPTAQAQLQQQEQQQHQQFLPLSPPPSQPSPQEQQRAAELQQSYDVYLQWGYENQQPNLLPPQQQLAGEPQQSNDVYLQWDYQNQQPNFLSPQQANPPLPSLPTPPQQQPAIEPQQSYDVYAQWDYPNQQLNFLPPQQATPPPPLPTQGYQYPPPPGDDGMLPQWEEWMT